MSEPVALADYEPLAREKLSHMAFEFLIGGAADEITLRENREAYDRIRLRPRVLEEIESIDTRVELLGQPLPHPILLAPVGYQMLFHPEGEVEAARGAKKAGAVYVVSTSTNSTIEDIAAAGASMWLQVYIQTDREVTRDLIARAEGAGVRALCLTVDTPVLGMRNRQERAGFRLPPEFPTPHLDRAGRQRLGTTSSKRQSITWRDVEWLRGITHVPLLLKGILTGDDAQRAIDHGVAGILVSNHGARNLDTVPATIDALAEVAERVAGRVPLLVDGGIRRGTDVVKALAFGAKAVLIGRPYTYGLAVGGAEGVARVVAILREELETAMALLGRPSVAAIDRSVLW